MVDEKVTTHHADKFGKFGFKSVGELIHQYFDLEGEYIGLMDTEVITFDWRNLCMDVSYKRTGNVINNVELQSSAVNMDKMETIAEYIKYILINNSSLAECIILTNVDPKYCVESIRLTESLILRPIYKYISPEDVELKLNNMSYKILNNQILTIKEQIEFMMLPLFASTEQQEGITTKVCYLFAEYSKFMDYMLKLKISFSLGILVDRNIGSNNDKKILWDVIDMEKAKDSIEELIDEEITERDIIIRNQANQLKENDLKLIEQQSQLKEKDLKLIEQQSQLDENTGKFKRILNVVTNSNDNEIKNELLSILLPSK